MIAKLYAFWWKTRFVFFRYKYACPSFKKVVNSADIAYEDDFNIVNDEKGHRVHPKDALYFILCDEIKEEEDK